MQARAFHEELERNLVERAGGDELRLAADRRWVGVDRLLARLQAVAPGDWAMTGEFAVDARSHRPRVPDELTVEWWVKSAESFPHAPRVAAKHDAGDFFSFELDMAGGVATGREGAQLFTVSAYLADEPFEQFQATFRIRYGNLPSDRARISDLLRFAGIEGAEVQAVALEMLVAESLHAYTVGYVNGWLYEAARRLRELALIAEISGLKATLLLRATTSIFASKGDADLLSEAFAPPTEEIAKNFEYVAANLDLGFDAETAHEEVSTMIDPVMSGDVPSRSTWNAADRLWLPD